MKSIAVLTLLLLTVSLIYSQDPCQPLWPRIQFGNTFSDASNNERLIIRFNTRSECPKSYAIVSGSKGDIRKVYCEANFIQCSEKMNFYKTFVQRCSISSIDFESEFQYFVYGSNTTSGNGIPFSSEPIRTTLLHPNSTKDVGMIVLADWSQIHEELHSYKSINETLNKLRNDRKPDGMMINGDIAYDLDTNNGTNYECFLNMLSQIARQIPVFVNTGNHQHNSDDALKLFYNSFEMYGKDKRLANSLSLGPLFLIGFDPYEVLYKTKSLSNLRKADPVSLAGLAEAIQNGTKTGKFMIPSSHYPLKCSADNKNCQNNTKYLKDYWDLMFKNDINFYIGAHYHTYERIYPYCQNETFSFTKSPYQFQKDEHCIISIIEGIAGNDEKIVETYDNVKEYTAKLSYGKTGVGLLTVGLSSVKYQHFSSENVLNLEDEFEIIYKTEAKLLEE